MKNLLIVALVAWLLFFGGISTLRNFASGVSIEEIPSTVLTGAQRLADTAQPAATTPQTTPQPQRPTAPVVVVSRMAALPTATTEPTATPFCGGGWYQVTEDGRVWCEPKTPEAQPAPTVAIPATPIVYVSSPADCIPRPLSDACWRQFEDGRGEVSGASPDCYPLPADDPCWRKPDD